MDRVLDRVFDQGAWWAAMTGSAVILSTRSTAGLLLPIIWRAPADAGAAADAVPWPPALLLPPAAAPLPLLLLLPRRSCSSSSSRRNVVVGVTSIWPCSVGIGEVRRRCTLRGRRKA